MAKIEAAVICVLIVIIDIIAGVLSIKAENVQLKVKQPKWFILYGYCIGPSHKALKLGLLGAGLLLVAHVIANWFGGCTIYSKREFVKSSANKQLAMICLVISWMILVVGFPILVIGAAANAKPKASCVHQHRNFLSTGGILCFFHGLFCLSYYVSAAAAFREDVKSGRREGGVKSSPPLPAVEKGEQQSA